jgi:hypothetical protein
MLLRVPVSWPAPQRHRCTQFLQMAASRGAASSPSHALLKKALPAALIVCVLVYLVSLPRPAVTGHPGHAVDPRPATHVLPFTKEVVNGGVTAYWAAPPRDVLLQGVLLLFHGCSHSGEVWYRNPEEVIFVEAALGHGLATLAFSSADRSTGCWQAVVPVIDNADMDRITPAILPILAKITGKVRSAQGLFEGPHCTTRSCCYNNRQKLTRRPDVN